MSNTTKRIYEQMDRYIDAMILKPEAITLSRTQYAALIKELNKKRDSSNPLFKVPDYKGLPVVRSNDY